MKLRALSMLVLVLVFSLLAVSARADSLGPDLSTFAVLGAAAVTNASGGGPAATLITGNLGSATAVTGFPPGVVTGGTIDPGNVAAAQANLTSAFTTISGEAVTGLIGPGGLSGASLVAGVYDVTSAAFDLTAGSTLTLNGTGSPNGTWVFIMSSSLITASGTTVDTSTLGPDASVYWIVQSAATLGDNTDFEGNILALDQIAFDPGAQDPCGRALSKTAGVTFAGVGTTIETGQSAVEPNLVSIGCGNTTATTGGGFNGGGGTPVSTPEPGTLVLLSSGVFGMVFLTFRKSRRVSSLRAC
jgi:hypothetical protein